MIYDGFVNGVNVIQSSSYLPDMYVRMFVVYIRYVFIRTFHENSLSGRLRSDWTDERRRAHICFVRRSYPVHVMSCGSFSNWNITTAGWNIRADPNVINRIHARAYNNILYAFSVFLREIQIIFTQDVHKRRTRHAPRRLCALRLFIANVDAPVRLTV